MTIDEYQIWTYSKMRRHSDFNFAKLGAAMGIPGEVGELLEVVKKDVFHGKPADRDMIAKEAGDVLFYLANLCLKYGVSMTDVIDSNVAKLNARYPNGYSEDRSHAAGSTPSEERKA